MRRAGRWRCGGVYWGSDDGREFDILVDGSKRSAHRKLTGNPNGEYFDVAYPIPAMLIAGKSSVTVKFQPKRGSNAGGVFDVRIVTGK